MTQADIDELARAVADAARNQFKFTVEQWASQAPWEREGWVQRWRLSNLYWIEDEHGEKRKFVPTPIQWDFFNNLWWRTIVLKARQVRISTASLILTLDRVLFNANHTAGIVDKTDEDGKRKLARIKFAYDHLDDRDDPRTAGLGALIKQAVPVRFSNYHEFQLHENRKIWASTSMRGGTLQTLWITELGKTAVEEPDKAREIKKGALNAIHAGATGIIEATFEGGRTGVFYDLIRLAQQTPRDPTKRAATQWALQFFGWAAEPTYSIDLPADEILTPSQKDYFAKIEWATGRKLSPAQRNWYVLKAREQGADMVTEFPGTVEEALQAIPEGSIYGDQILIARATGRICPLVVDGQAPLFTSWDLGERDATAVWLLQIVGPDVHAIDYHCANGGTPADHAAKMLQWERQYKRPISMHYIPHDGAQRKAGTTWHTELKKAGLEHLTVVDRIANVWIGIGQTREKLPSFRFNSETCERDFLMGDGETRWPSGIAALESYRKRAIAANGNISWEPIHDECESGASALRTFCEAAKRGLLVGPSQLERRARGAVSAPGRALTGIGGTNRLRGLAIAR